MMAKTRKQAKKAGGKKAKKVVGKKAMKRVRGGVLSPRNAAALFTIKT